MKKWGLSVLAVLLIVGSGYASLENTATAGLFFNDLDNVVDELDIFGVEKNVSDLAIQGWNSTSVNSGFTLNDIAVTLGLVNGLPIKLSAKIFWNEALAGNPAYSNSQQILFQDVNADTYYDTKQVNAFSMYDYADNGYRSIKVIAGLPMATPMSVSYQYQQNVGLRNATYALSAAGLGAISTGSVSQNYDLSGTLLSETADVFGLGYNDTGMVSHTLTWAMKLGAMQLYVPLVYEIGYGSDQKASETNYTSNPGTLIPLPNYMYQTYSYNDKVGIMQVNPILRLILKSDPADYMEIFAQVGFGVGVNRPQGLIGEYYSIQTNLAMGAFVQTTVTERRNDDYRNNFSYMPLSLVVFPYVNKTVSEKVRIGYGLRATVGYSTAGFTSYNTNKTVTTYNDGDAEANDPNDYTQTVLAFQDSYNYALTGMSMSLNIPIALQYAVSKVMTLRFGADIGVNFTNNVEDIVYINDQPSETTTVYGDGTSSVTYTALNNPISARNVATGFNTSVMYYTGAGFALDDNLALDVVLTGTWLITVSSFDVQIRYAF